LTNLRLTNLARLLILFARITSARNFMRNNIMQNKTANSTDLSAVPFQTSQTYAGVLLAGTKARGQSANTVGRFITVEGNRIWIEERGKGIPIVMSAGGQNRVETLRPLSEKLSAKYRVITWDRANMGRSDLVLKGARDIDIWTDQQAGIMTQLNARPAYLVYYGAALSRLLPRPSDLPDHGRRDHW
jgi:hypothetical protein